MSAMDFSSPNEREIFYLTGLPSELKEEIVDWLSARELRKLLHVGNTQLSQSVVLPSRSWRMRCKPKNPNMYLSWPKGLEMFSRLEVLWISIQLCVSHYDNTCLWNLVSPLVSLKSLHIETDFDLGEELFGNGYARLTLFRWHTTDAFPPPSLTHLSLVGAYKVVSRRYDGNKKVRERHIFEALPRTLQSFRLATEGRPRMGPGIDPLTFTQQPNNESLKLLSDDYISWYKPEMGEETLPCWIPTEVSFILHSLCLEMACAVTDTGISYLPKTLTLLELRNADSLTNEAIARLPRDLTIFRLGAPHITNEALLHLPASITTLKLDTWYRDEMFSKAGETDNYEPGKITGECLEILKTHRSLQSLFLHTGHPTFEQIINLPRSITHLSVRSDSADEPRGRFGDDIIWSPQLRTMEFVETTEPRRDFVNAFRRRPRT